MSRRCWLCVVVMTLFGKVQEAHNVIFVLVIVEAVADDRSVRVSIVLLAIGLIVVCVVIIVAWLAIDKCTACASSVLIVYIRRWGRQHRCARHGVL